MSHNQARDQRRGGRGTVEARKRRRMRPTLMALEDRRLLSTFTVTSTLDNGSVGTLRWAVGQANSAGGAETIAFDKTVFKTPQTITLTGTQLELSDTSGTETITGPKAGVTVSGGGQIRVFQVDGGVTASISRLTITGGRRQRQRRQQRRRPGQPRRHRHANQLHRQRKLHRRCRRRPVQRPRRHDHAESTAPSTETRLDQVTMPAAAASRTTAAPSR